MDIYNTWLDLLPIELQDIIFEYVIKSKMTMVLSDLVINLTPYSYALTASASNPEYATKHNKLCELIGIDNERRYGESIFYCAKQWYNHLLEENRIGSRIIEIYKIIDNSSPHFIYLDELTYLELVSFNEFYSNNDNDNYYY